jgi:hypothetical protein
MAAAKKKKKRVYRRRHRAMDPNDRERYRWEDVFTTTLRGLVDSGNLKSPVEQAADIADASVAAFRKRYPTGD